MSPRGSSFECLGPSCWYVLEAVEPLGGSAGQKEVGYWQGIWRLCLALISATLFLLPSSPRCNKSGLQLHCHMLVPLWTEWVFSYLAWSSDIISLDCFLKYFFIVIGQVAVHRERSWSLSSPSSPVGKEGWQNAWSGSMNDVGARIDKKRV